MIDRLTITIEPELYGSSRQYKEVHITVMVNGEEAHYRRALVEDDMHSTYELICGIALESLGKAIREKFPARAGREERIG